MQRQGISMCVAHTAEGCVPRPQSLEKAGICRNSIEIDDAHVSRK